MKNVDEFTGIEGPRFALVMQDRRVMLAHGSANVATPGIQAQIPVEIDEDWQQLNDLFDKHGGHSDEIKSAAANIHQRKKPNG